MGAPGRPEAITAIPVRRPGRWIAGVLVVFLAAALVDSAVTNPRFHWDVVGQYLFAHRVLMGLLMTLELTATAMAVGIVLGLLLAIMRQSANPVVAGGSAFYIWFFRGTPVLVQLYFWANIASLYPVITLGIPFGGPPLVHGNANTLIPTFVAAVIGLGLNESAYMAEVVRAGLLSVDEGQTEAAHALGMTRMQTLRRIVLPQAMRVIIPPTGNETISMLKLTSIVSVIAMPELLYSVQLIYAANYLVVPLLIVASFWYLVVTSIFSIGQFYIERHYDRGSSRQQQSTPWGRLRHNVTTFRHAPVAVSGASGEGR
ncbi:MAG TPA: amino acid ABC transporter permease [Solirubrobacteraceae bacterium]|nr:amino acid ABC transporter permease [Solirubrobacteraceae bacterium]